MPKHQLEAENECLNNSHASVYMVLSPLLELSNTNGQEKDYFHGLFSCWMRAMQISIQFCTEEQKKNLDIPKIFGAFHRKNSVEKNLPMTNLLN